MRIFFFLYAVYSFLECFSTLHGEWDIKTHRNIEKHFEWWSSYDSCVQLNEYHMICLSIFSFIQSFAFWKFICIYKTNYSVNLFYSIEMEGLKIVQQIIKWRIPMTGEFLIWFFACATCRSPVFICCYKILLNIFFFIFKNNKVIEISHMWLNMV